MSDPSRCAAALGASGEVEPLGRGEAVDHPLRRRPRVPVRSGTSPGPDTGGGRGTGISGIDQQTECAERAEQRTPLPTSHAAESD